MVVYLDLVFLLNCIADALALYITSRLSGIKMYRLRVWIATLIGGVYGVICSIPFTAAAGNVFLQILVAAVLVLIVFGMRIIFLRLFTLFFVLSCAIGGVMIALAQSFVSIGVSDTLNSTDWKVFILVGGICYFLLSAVFSGSASHVVAGQICDGSICRNGKKESLNILLDTGHSLTDMLTGEPVLIVWLDALKNLWNKDEWSILSRLSIEGEAVCCEKLATIAPGVFRLIPYRAVGVCEGLLLCFSVENAVVNECTMGRTTVAISATPLSDGCGCNALWGGGLHR